MKATYLRTILGMIFGGLLLMTQTASASNWSSSASVCQPGVNSAGIYTFSGARLTFSGTTTGEITSRCHVTNPSDSGVPTWSTLVMGYQDPDGTGINYQVTAQLVRVDKSSGVSTIIKTLSSNSFAGTGAAAHSITFTHTFDFDANAYFITLTLDRVDSNANPAVWYMELK